MTDARHVHFVGIGGIHMSGLARLLLDDGVEVSGSDVRASRLTEALAARGARVHVGHDAGHVAGADLVVRTVAVPDENPELVAARNAGVAILSRAEMVARVCAGLTTLAVGGTHGKTTTSTMLALILREAGLGPSYLLGGESADLGTHAERGAGPLMVVEADEYARAFHHYTPQVAVITNVDRDHLDYYGSDEALREAFVGFGRTIVPGGTLLVGAESVCANAVLETLRAERPDLDTHTFGLAETGEWTWSASAMATTDGWAAEVRQAGAALGSLRLVTPGIHNVRNALAATAVAVLQGAPFEAAQRALSRFQGVERRFQPVGEAGGVLVVDDYAHHPAEIEATLAAARTLFPERRIVVLFQPHTYSRSRYLLERFRTCFRDADALYVTDTYAARETPDQGLAAVDLAARIRHAIYVGSLSEAARAVAEAARGGDVIFTMGAGDVDAAGPQLLELLGAAT